MGHLWRATQEAMAMIRDAKRRNEKPSAILWERGDLIGLEFELRQLAVGGGLSVAPYELSVMGVPFRARAE